MSPLLRELVTASRTAHEPAMADALKRAGFRFSGLCGLWGVARVSADSSYYEPLPDEGALALINGVYECGHLIDLAATSIRSRAMRRRTGEGRLLGDGIPEIARMNEHPLIVYRDAFAWMSAGGHGVVVLDWPSVATTLADLPHGLICQTDALARRLRRSFERPVRQPPLYVPQPNISGAKEAHHAA